MKFWNLQMIPEGYAGLAEMADGAPALVTAGHEM